MSGIYSSLRIALFAVLLLVGLLHPCHATAMVHHTQKTKQQVEELEQQWRAASLAGDLATLDRMLSDDYVGISWTGEVSTKAMQLEHMRTHSFMLTRLDLKERKIKMVGNVAIVTALASVEGVNGGAAMKGLFRYTRIYQKLPNGAWKITNFEVTRLSDGPRPPRPPA